MKLNYLFFGLLLSAISLQAQFTFVDGNGTIYEDGDVYATNSVVFADSSLKYFITNPNAETIYLKAELVSATVDGSDGEICFGLCYTVIAVGQTYPFNGSIELLAGATTPDGNHIFHGGPNVDASLPADYVFRFYQTDMAGTTAIGPELSITYRYDPTLGLEEASLFEYAITSTVIRETLEITSQENLQIAIYDLQGRLVKNEMILAGTQQISMGDLATQAYIVQLTNENKVSQTTRVIKR
ncbi:T9SS type A sorting domain-containing protein [Patiriisocius sp. Uisw_017]|jgi:hypothetical protein|uniref:T9SS type A sorting domain-containing protein n=1 Tax=Patiriisocius sp. Uisw_017 TaxID=3230968 RepID=UPI0039E84266